MKRFVRWPLERKQTASRLRRRTEQKPAVSLLSPERFGLAVGTTVLLALLLCIHLWPNRVSLRLGEVARVELTAQRTVRYEDTEATQRLRAEAAAGIEKHYDLLPDAPRNTLDSIKAVFDALNVVGPLPENSLDIQRQSGIALSPPSVDALRTATPEQRQLVQEAIRGIVRRLMDGPIRDDTDDLERLRKTITAEGGLANLPPTVQQASIELASHSLTNNRHYNERETQRARDEAIRNVPRQIRRIAAGASLIHPGERVTQSHLDAFTALGLRNATVDGMTVTVICAMVVLLVGFVSIYLRLFHRELYADTKKLYLLSILTLISVTGIKVGSTLLGLPFTGVHFGYLGMMCVASAGMVIALLISPQVATLIVALLSVGSGVVLNNELRFTLITLGSSLVGIVSASTLRNRADLLRATLVLCGANALLNLMIGLLESDSPPELLSAVLWGMVSGLFALALFYLGAAVFERAFGLTTHLRLLELSDPATPILQEFRMAVPGTYAHSLMVGNLAHAAAEAIGADALLVRVAAYYHDLGKMNRPEFFIENQTNAENVHERINPSLSAIVLASHVKEGLEIAEAVGLPPNVRAVISQHHGTSLMKYFYFQATGGIPDPSLEPQFRYPGPKPQTKEAAILMLADGCEAASRVLEKPTPQRISEFVTRMIDDKVRDGQLNECDLTLRDLNTIQEIFTRILSGTLHARIEYPGSPVNPPATSVISHGDKLSDSPAPDAASGGSGRFRRTKTARRGR